MKEKKEKKRKGTSPRFSENKRVYAAASNRILFLDAVILSLPLAQAGSSFSAKLSVCHCVVSFSFLFAQPPVIICSNRVVLSAAAAGADLPAVITNEKNRQTLLAGGKRERKQVRVKLLLIVLPSNKKRTKCDRK